MSGQNLVLLNGMVLNPLALRLVLASMAGDMKEALVLRSAHCLSTS